MKKRGIVFSLVVCMLITLCCCACDSGESDNVSKGDIDNNSNLQKIESIAIVSDVTEISAGQSFNVELLINNDDSFDYSNMNYEIIITSGFEYCTILDDNILIQSNSPNNQQVTFYVKYSNVKSENYTFTILNRKTVIEAQIKAKEDELANLQKEYDRLSSQVDSAQNDAEMAQGEYEDYQYQCISYGYLTSSGDYKYNTPSNIRAQLERLFATWQEADDRFMRLYDMLDSKESEIRNLQSEIANLKQELALL